MLIKSSISSFAAEADPADQHPNDCKRENLLVFVSK